MGCQSLKGTDEMIKGPSAAPSLFPYFAPRHERTNELRSKMEAEVAIKARLSLQYLRVNKAAEIHLGHRERLQADMQRPHAGPHEPDLRRIRPVNPVRGSRLSSRLGQPLPTAQCVRRQARLFRSAVASTRSGVVKPSANVR
jgi:hypothetical protein